jgi:hypothetical protein
MNAKVFVVVMSTVLLIPSFLLAGINDGLIAYYSFDEDARDQSGNHEITCFPSPRLCAALLLRPEITPSLQFFPALGARTRTRSPAPGSCSFSIVQTTCLSQTMRK